MRSTQDHSRNVADYPVRALQIRDPAFDQAQDLAGGIVQRIAERGRTKTRPSCHFDKIWCRIHEIFGHPHDLSILGAVLQQRREWRFPRYNRFPPEFPHCRPNKFRGLDSRPRSVPRIRVCPLGASFPDEQLSSTVPSLRNGVGERCLASSCNLDNQLFQPAPKTARQALLNKSNHCQYGQ